MYRYRCFKSYQEIVEYANDNKLMIVQIAKADGGMFDVIYMSRKEYHG